MQNHWKSSASSLPLAGEQIEFMLVGRYVPLTGTYANGVFRAQWSDYGIDRVDSWRMCEGAEVTSA